MPGLRFTHRKRCEASRVLDDLDLDWVGAITVVEWGSGKVESLVDAWLRVALDRPTGVAADTDGEEPDEPRRVVIRGHGARGRELEAALRA